MNIWDAAAAARLEDVRAELEGAGLVEAFQTDVRQMWRANCERYEPDELCDTPTGIGLVSAINLAGRMERRLSQDPWPASGVRVTRPENSLLIRVGSTQLQLRKSPGSGLTPHWDAMTHEESQGLRRHMHASGNNLYQPSQSDQTGQPWLLPLDEYVQDDPTVLQHATLVWCGALNGSALTAGWLAFPWTGPVPWLAATELWTDTDGRGDRTGTTPGSPSTGDTFDTRPAPPVKLGLKPTGRQNEGQA